MKQISHQLVYAAFGLLLLLAGCQRDDLRSDDATGKHGNPGKLVEVAVSIGVGEVMSVENSTSTRANGEPDIQVYDFYLFQFDGTGDEAKLVASPTYVKAGKADELHLTQLTASEEAEHRVVAIANLNNDTYPWPVTPKTTTYKQLRALSATLTRDDATACHPDGCVGDYPVMSATCTGEIRGGNNTPERGLIELEFTLSVAKLNVTLVNEAEDLIIERVTVVNMPSALPYTAALNKESDAVTTIRYATVPPHLEEDIQKDQKDQTYSHTFYLPANSFKDVVTGIGNITRVNRFAPPKATCVQFIVREKSTGNRYTTTLYVGGWSTADGGTFDFDIAHNKAYTLHYTIKGKNDYFFDERTDPYLSTNNYCSTTVAGAYIRTGIYPGKQASKSIRYEIDYATPTLTANYVLMGSGPAGDTAGTYSLTSTTTRGFFAGEGTNALFTTTANTTRHTDIFEIDLSPSVRTVTATYDGERKEPVEFTGNLGKEELYLFCNNVDNQPSVRANNMRLYRFKVWIDGVLIRDMLAMPADFANSVDGHSTSSAGMYDYVTQAFFAPPAVQLTGIGQPDKPFVFTIDTSKGDSSADNTYIVPFKTGSNAFDFYIDWGDNTQSDYQANMPVTTAMLTHTYPQPGQYTISVFSPTGEMPIVYFGSSTEAPQTPVTTKGNPNKLTGLQTGLLYMNTTGLNYLFCGCANLTGELPQDLIAGNSQVINIASMFRECTSLKKLPRRIFATNATITIARIFQDCTGLEGEIPEDVFADCPHATSFGYAFYNCKGLEGKIPPNLFAKRPDITSYQNTFFGCENLKGPIPPGLFADSPNVTIFNNTFDGCKKLEGTIPQNLFADKTFVTTFAYTFRGCVKLSGPLPDGLFDDCPNVTTFAYTFSGCTVLNGEIPKGLFAKNLKVTTFSYVFNGVPDIVLTPHIFVNDESVKDECAARFAGVASVSFIYAFNSTVSRTFSRGTAPQLWVHEGEDLYKGSGKFISTSTCFLGARNNSNTNGLINYLDIPTTWGGTKQP